MPAVALLLNVFMNGLNGLLMAYGACREACGEVEACLLLGKALCAHAGAAAGCFTCPVTSQLNVAACKLPHLCVGMLASPESPRWLAATGAHASAEAAARRLWGPAGVQELGTVAGAPGGGVCCACWVCHDKSCAEHFLGTIRL